MAAPVRVGEVLANKYEVTRILGEGGMGVVVAARHRELDKLVALKFMHVEVAAQGPAIDRFLREARAAARLTNEHVGRVLDVGRLDDGIPYIVMEYLEGRDLQALLDESGPLDVASVCEYVLQTCEAMAEAHAQGIIHRDLKPQNLFLTMRQDGRPLIKVLDFGISKVRSTTGPTGTQTMMGTPSHMSPEQMRSSRSVDPRADIWSLGVILFQLLTEKLPFAGESPTELIVSVMHDPVPDLARIRPGMPPALIAAIEKCLEKDRDARFDNVAELAHELTPFVPERARAAISLIERVMTAGGRHAVPPTMPPDDDDVVPSASTVPGRAPVAAPQPTTLGSAAGQSIAARQRGARRWLVVIPIGVLAAIGIGAVAMRDSDSTIAPAATQHDAVPAGHLDSDTTAASQIDAAFEDAMIAVDAGTDAPDAPRHAATPRDAATRKPIRDAAVPAVTPSIDADVWKPEPPRMDGGLAVPRNLP